MLFFQTMLLAGYLYAAWMGQLRKPALQVVIHLMLLGATLFFLPITPSDRWKPLDGEHPTWRILTMLFACLGFPYFVLSSTSTLIQNWYAIASPKTSPYRLYALSNIGSFGALALYPWLVEPVWNTTEQGRMWSLGFIAFAFGICFLGLLLWRIPATSDGGQIPSDGTETTDVEIRETSWGDRAVWFLLPALSSLMLLGVTNYLCQDVAVIPFLWIAPLSVYLVSLIICFDRDRWYIPGWFSLGTVVAIIAVVSLALIEFWQRYNGNQVARSAQLDIRLIIVAYLIMFFLVCMLCHGETVRRRPSLRYLSQFYISIAAGSALGAFLVAILCPMIFTTYAEFNFGLLLSLMLGISVFVQSQFGPLSEVTWGRIKLFAISVMVSVVFLGGDQWIAGETVSRLPQVRNFYGTMHVRELSKNEPEHQGLALFHGSTMHGFQHLLPEKKNDPTAYFTEDSGIGIGLRTMQERGPLKVGVVGLGIGTLAAYGRQGDTFRFYEINPLVIRLAEQNFAFLKSSDAKIEIVLGDARLALEREDSQQFDVLILDAFNSDAVPIHLLTDEAIEIYQKHLKPDGLLAFQVTNRLLDLVSVIAKHAERRQLQSVLIRQRQSVYSEKMPSGWFLVTENDRLLASPKIRDAKEEFAVNPSISVWTDSYYNLFQILRTGDQ